MLAARCRIERKEDVTDRHTIWATADRLQMNLRTCQAQLTELRSYLAALDLPQDWKPPRAGSPRDLHPDACPHCELAAGHTTDCPTTVHPHNTKPAAPPDNPSNRGERRRWW